MSSSKSMKYVVKWESYYLQDPEKGLWTESQKRAMRFYSVQDAEMCVAVGASRVVKIIPKTEPEMYVLKSVDGYVDEPFIDPDGDPDYIVTTDISKACVFDEFGAKVFAIAMNKTFPFLAPLKVIPCSSL